MRCVCSTYTFVRLQIRPGMAGAAEALDISVDGADEEVLVEPEFILLALPPLALLKRGVILWLFSCAWLLFILASNELPSKFSIFLLKLTWVSCPWLLFIPASTVLSFEDSSSLLKLTCGTSGKKSSSLPWLVSESKEITWLSPDIWDNVTGKSTENS